MPLNSQHGGGRLGKLLYCCAAPARFTARIPIKRFNFIASARATRREGKINSRKLLTQKRGKIAKHIGMEGKFTFI